ncbi:MAG: metalloregulator ArsR/SmtB family transcription factor [Verrucomicrobiota bacterium]|nr:metalloregulator ArsR/SmtB family transcription factor [Verrucomicrobiota bacterium]
MASTLKSLRALSAPSRLRLLALLNESDLTVRELTEITNMRQSGISMHLGQMQEAGLVESSRDGKNAYYRIARENGMDNNRLVELAAAGAVEIPEHASDCVNLKRILERRENQDLVYFNRVAGRFDSVYGPGRSWQAFGQMLLRLVPEIVVADLGSGEGLLSELLARNCKRVIAVDNSEKIVKFGQAKAARNGLANLEFRQGDLQNPPIDDASVDLAILSQALHHAEEPAQAIAGAFRILKLGGRLMILDLVAHKFEQARELFGDCWLGFAESELHCLLESAGFGAIDISVVSREEEEPHFETLLASAMRPA